MIYWEHRSESLAKKNQTKTKQKHNMYGSIEFKDSASLAYFLSCFSGCSATFKVTQDDDKFTLTFTGSR